MTDTAIQTILNNFAQDVANMKPVLEAMAQLLRDSQIAQAGNEKLSYHTRTQILHAIEDLQNRTQRIEQTSAQLSDLVKDLREDHDGHNEDLRSILTILETNREMFEELLGYKVNPAPSPLAGTIKEITTIVRKLGDKDPGTGEPLDGLRITIERVKAAFWNALGAAILVFILLKVAPSLIQLATK